MVEIIPGATGETSFIPDSETPNIKIFINAYFNSNSEHSINCHPKTL